MSDIVYIREADKQARQDRHGNRIQTYAAGTLARCYVTIKRYTPKAKIYHEFNANGRDVWMGEKAHAIYLEAISELKAGHDLHTGQIANVTGASQGYVTKVLQFLMRFCFIVITAVIRGRYGRLVGRLATAANKSFLHTRRSVSIWRNDFALTDPRHVDPFGSWARSLARMGLADA